MQRKKKPVLTIKTKIFRSQKIPVFSKWLTHAFGQKMPVFLYLDLIKITLEIMLSEFAMKKETFFDLKKQNSSESKKSHFFQRG